MRRILAALAFSITALGVAPVSAAGPDLTAFDALHDALVALWLQTPLTVRNAALTEGAASGMGIYVPAPDSSYKLGEPVNVYAEVIGYHWKANTDGTFSSLMDVDLFLETPDGATVASQEKFLSSELKSRRRNLETFFALDVTLTEFAPGPYVLEYRVTDNVTGQQASFTVPITLTE